MSNVALTLPESVIQHAKALTGKRTARAAVIAAIGDRGNVPNAETARALRSKARGKVFNSAKEAMAYLDSL